MVSSSWSVVAGSVNVRWKRELEMRRRALERGELGSEDIAGGNMEFAGLLNLYTQDLEDARSRSSMGQCFTLNNINLDA